jgi:hypothetical protein
VERRRADPLRDGSPGWRDPDADADLNDGDCDSNAHRDGDAHRDRNPDAMAALRLPDQGGRVRGCVLCRRGIYLWMPADFHLNCYAHAHTESYPHGDSDADAHTNPDADRASVCLRVLPVRARRGRRLGLLCVRDAHRHRDTDRYRDGHAHRDRDRHAHSNRHSNADRAAADLRCR